MAPISRKFGTRPNAWLWDVPFKAILTITLICTIIDLLNLSEGDTTPSSAGKYGFITTIRETRRTFTLKMYARGRGQMLKAELEGIDPMSPRGVAQLEDTIGGLISGPPSLWRNGEIIVNTRTPQDPVPSYTLTNLHVAASKYWNNGYPEVCRDRELTFHGQSFDDDGINVIYLGMLEFKCDKQEQQGYLSVLAAPYHGGPLSGRVYRVHATLGLEQFGENATSYDGTVPLRLTELGAFIEPRGFANRWHLIAHLLGLLLPLLMWVVIKNRVRRTVVSINAVEVKGGKKYEMKGRIEKRVVETWSNPLGYVAVAITIFIHATPHLESELEVLRLVAPQYQKFRPNYFACGILLLAQELVVDQST